MIGTFVAGIGFAYNGFISNWSKLMEEFQMSKTFKTKGVDSDMPYYTVLYIFNCYLHSSILCSIYSCKFEIIVEWSAFFKEILLLFFG